MVATTAVAVALLGACGSDDGGEVRNLGTGADGSASAGGSPSGSGSGSASGTAAECIPVGDPDTADGTVAVTLDEWTITPAARSVAAGSVAFAAENVGEEVHELVVVRDVGELPIVDGAVDEAALPEGAFLGEIEGFPPGETCDGVFELEAGDYTLFCNIVEEESDGTIESHVENGMVTTITVD